MFSSSLVTPPAVEPVTLAEMKAHLRIDTNADDALITNLIVGARQLAERYTNRAFITQTWKLALDLKELDSGNGIRFPHAPLQSISNVQYFDDTDTATTWAAGNYFVDTLSEPGRLVLRLGATWPTPSRTANSVIVTYIAGYGNDASSVPEPIKTAIRELVACAYEHRGDEDTVSSSPVTFAAQMLLGPYRVRQLGI